MMSTDKENNQKGRGHWAPRQTVRVLRSDGQRLTVPEENTDLSGGDHRRLGLTGLITRADCEGNHPGAGWIWRHQVRESRDSSASGGLAQKFEYTVQCDRLSCLAERSLRTRVVPAGQSSANPMGTKGFMGHLAMPSWPRSLSSTSKLQIFNSCILARVYTAPQPRDLSSFSFRWTGGLTESASPGPVRQSVSGCHRSRQAGGRRALLERMHSGQGCFSPCSSSSGG